MWSCTVCHHHHTVTIFSDIANYTKEIRIAKYSMRGDVCGHVLSPPLSIIRGRDANRQFKRNAWYTCAQLRYLVSDTWYTRALVCDTCQSTDDRLQILKRKENSWTTTRVAVFIFI